jgi:superfamily I DNA/RNA helicase
MAHHQPKEKEGEHYVHKNNKAFTLSEEQQAILDTLPLLVSDTAAADSGGDQGRRGVRRRGQVVRITAAAGAGKTTTLLKLAEWANALLYPNIQYLTFSKAAANDAIERFRTERMKQQQQRPTNTNTTTTTTIVARTLHSAAYHLVREVDREQQRGGRMIHESGAEAVQDEEEEGDDADSTIWHDGDIKKWIAKECTDAIDELLVPCDQEIAARHSRQRGAAANHRQQPSQHLDGDQAAAARDMVKFFLFKSLQHFCHNKFSLDEYRMPCFGRDYYPARQFHEKGGRGEQYGFLPSVYGSSSAYSAVAFYAATVHGLFTKAQEQQLRGHDFNMKRAQLGRLPITPPCDLLLVDECQDMDGCQIDWIRSQAELFGTHVYLVGDPAQAIYGFRGAKPKHLQECATS